MLQLYLYSKVNSTVNVLIFWFFCWLAIEFSNVMPNYVISIILRGNQKRSLFGIFNRHMFYQRNKIIAFHILFTSENYCICC